MYRPSLPVSTDRVISVSTDITTTRAPTTGWPSVPTIFPVRMSLSWAETTAGSASSSAKKTLRTDPRPTAFTGKEKIERRKLKFTYPHRVGKNVYLDTG